MLACQPLDTQAPEITFVTPTDGASLAKDTIRIKVIATDDVGVSKVEFRIDDVLKATETASRADTFSYKWDASTVSTGTHSIKAKAYDNAGNSQQAAISVNIGTTGGTIHNQDITADETWYPSGNPHIIETDISVENGATLTIMPGCIVKFKNDKELYCGYGQAGAIVAEGKPDSLIKFTSFASNPAPGAWRNVGVYSWAMSNTRFKYCEFEYGGSSSSYGTVYVRGAAIRFDNCKISNSAERGIIAESDGRFTSFTNNTITTCAKYPIKIQAHNAGTLGTGNTLTGNASGYDAIELQASNVGESQTWRNHGVPYVLMSSLGVGSTNSPTLTIEPGVTIKFGPGVEFYCGYTYPGAIAAVGTASQPITFTSSASSPTPGSWENVGVYENATAATRFAWCNFSYGGGASGYGTFYVNGARPSFDNCQISHSADYGVYITGNGYFTSSVNNTITTCAKYPIRIQPDFAGTIGTGNTLTGNASGYDGIEIAGGEVTQSQTWRNHGVPYFVKADVDIAGSNSPELTIAPSTIIKLQPDAEFYCGYNRPGALIADGTAGRITFTSAATPPSPGSWDYVSFYDNSLASSKLVNCDITYGGSSYGNIYISNCRPTITGCYIAYSATYGIYLDGTTYPDPAQLLSNNTFENNQSGSVRVPQN